MSFVFYFLASVLVFSSYKSLRGGINYLNFFKKELARPKPNFAPFVSIIAPCRGMDAGLEENLTALFRQNFPACEILFVVDDDKDKAVPVIQKIIQRAAAENSPVTAKLIVAGIAESGGQKVHNLREAILRVSDKSEVFVFVDSDARPGKNWLRNLIAPLYDDSIGAATGYRWFISKSGNFASELRAVWNASIASALGENTKTNFCWGGATAVRRKTFEKLDLREKWRGTLSDDFTVTRTMKTANLPIYFVPQALTASVEDCTFGELLEFTTRQMKITRVYAPHLWIQAFIGAFLFNLVFIWGIFIIFTGSFNQFSFYFASLALTLIGVFSAGKSYLRLKAVRLILKNYEKELNRQFRTQNVFWILTPALFFYNCFCALISRRIVWRGIEYELISHEQTSIVGK